MAGRTLSLVADLSFSLESAGVPTVTGHLAGSGGELRLTVDHPAVFAGSGDAHAVREVASELARHGLRVHVETTDGRALVSLGDVHSPWWQRWATRSRHVRVGSLRGAVTSARARTRSDAGVLPAGDLKPPATPFPLAPTFLRRPVRRVTTTHDPHRGGLPRLVLLPGDGIWTPEEPVYWVQRSEVRIGSDPGCDLVLPGLEPRHAVLRHDESDEFVIEAVGQVRVNGQPVERALLRTGMRLQLGDHLLTFVREEYADHGRPFGGRIGGELGRQRTQPARPEVDR